MMLRRILWTLLLLLGPISLAQAGGCHTGVSVQVAAPPQQWVPLVEEPRAQQHIDETVELHSVAPTDDCNACDLACLQSCASACAIPLEIKLCRPDAVVQEFAVLSTPSRPSHTLPLLRPPAPTF
jgi:hypothetical protein